MYSIISALATPIIVINATRNYFAWSDAAKDTAEKIRSRQLHWNTGIASSLFLTGATAVYAHATKFQKPTPLIMSAMAYRLVAIALIAFATKYSGDAVTDWCYRQASRS